MPSWAPPLAAAGELPPSFFHERTSDTLPCQSDASNFFCWDWARDHLFSRYGTPTLQHLKLVLLAVLIGFAIAFTLALLAHRRRWLRRRCWPRPGSSTRSPASPSSSCCCPSPAAASTPR